MVAAKLVFKLKKGDKAPNFSLRSVKDKLISLGDFKGHPLIVLFMCNHCPYTRSKLKEIVAIQNDYSSKGVVLIGINSNDPSMVPEDDFEHMKILAKDYGIKNYLVDTTQEVARDYGASCTPEAFVFNSMHSLVYHGRINNAINPEDKPEKNDLKEVLDKTLKGDEIKEWFIPSFGCTIKWKTS